MPKDYEDSFEKMFYEIEDLLKALELLYNSNMIDLRNYFEIKSNIIEKLIMNSKEEKNDIRERWLD